MRCKRATALHPRREQPRNSGAETVEAQEVGLDGAQRWKPWTAWPAIAVTFATVLAGRALVRGGGDPRMGVVVGLILQNLLCVGLAVLFAAAHGKPRAADFGLQRPRLPRAAGLAVAVWLGLFVFTAAWVGILGLEDDGPNITDRLAADQSTSQAVLVVVMVAVAVPLGEEFLFRGFVFRALSNWRGTVPAAILTGVGFAATHVGWLPIGVLFPVAMFGFVLCLLYHWTGSLYPPLAVHAFGNSLATTTALHWTWQTPLALAFSVLATLVIARLIAALLGERSPLPVL